MTTTPVNAEINVLVNTAQAMAQLRTLQAQVNKINLSSAAATGALSSKIAGLNHNMATTAIQSGLFKTSVIPMSHSIDQFSKSLDKSNLSLSQYSRGVMSQLPMMRKVFVNEFNTMAQVAESRVKRLQTQYTALGNGKALALAPTGLDKGFAAQAAINAQKQMIFNKMISDGSTKLVNWGKNTQWAGRQLMVGMTLPLTMFGAVAAKVFMDLDKQARDFKRVYGDAFTPPAEINKNLEAVKALGAEYTKYGIKVSETLNIGATAAAAGMRNDQLLAGTEQTLRLATVGQIDYQQALTTTISLQNAFKISNEQLGPSVDYIGAVANQTVLTVDDMTKAIPRVAPVVAGLGGDIKELAVALVAMREGGVSAEQGANAIKSGMANLINPTKAAVEMMTKLGINIKGIVKDNKGDFLGTIQAFGRALGGLDKFTRQQALEKVFGKYQYARLGALFDNITKKSGQTAVAMELMGKSSGDLAAMSAKSLNEIEQSTTAKFQASIEKLKIAIAPIGEAFLKAITPIANGLTKIAEWFNDLPDGVKNTVALVVGAVAGIGPVVLMLVGLIANGMGQMVKFVQFMRKNLARLRGDASAYSYMSGEQLDAAAATRTLEGATGKLTDKLIMQQSAVATLTKMYQTMASAAIEAAGGMNAASAVGMVRPIGRGPIPKYAAKGLNIVPGVGNKDTVPAMLTPGESVITKSATAKYAPVIAAMNAGTLKGFNNGLNGYEGIKNIRGEQITKDLVMAHGSDGYRLDSKGIKIIRDAWRDEQGNVTNASIASAKSMRGLSNMVFTLPAEFNEQGKGRGMSGTESAKLFDPKNSNVFKTSMSSIYANVAKHLNVSIQDVLNDKALMRDLDVMGKNIGGNLRRLGSKVANDPAFFDSVDKAIAQAKEGTKTVAPISARSAGIIDSLRSTVTVAKAGSELTQKQKDRYLAKGETPPHMTFDRVPLKASVIQAARDAKLFPAVSGNSYKELWKHGMMGQLPEGKALGGKYDEGVKDSLGIRSPSIKAKENVAMYEEGIHQQTVASIPEVKLSGEMLGKAYNSGVKESLNKNADAARSAISTNGNSSVWRNPALAQKMEAERLRMSTMTERQIRAESYRGNIDSGLSRAGALVRRVGSKVNSSSAGAAYGVAGAVDKMSNEIIKATSTAKNAIVTAAKNLSGATKTAASAIDKGAMSARWLAHDAARTARNFPAAMGVGAANMSPSMALSALGMSRRMDSARDSLETGLAKVNQFGNAMKSGFTNAVATVKRAGVLASDVGQALSNRDLRTGAETVKAGFISGAKALETGIKAIPGQIKAGGNAVANAMKSAAANIAATAVMAPGQIAGGIRQGVGGIGALPGRIRDKFRKSKPYGPMTEEQMAADEAKANARAGRKGAAMRGMNTATMAMMGMSMAGSFAEGALGDLSQKVMMASIGMMGLQMVLPMLTNPLGIAAVAAVAVGAGLWYTNKVMDDVRKSGQNMAAAMYATSGQIKGVGDFYGRQSNVKAANLKEYGTTAEALGRSQKFLETDTGKAMSEGFATAIKTVGQSNASKQFANKLGSMVMQGVITNDEAKNLAYALEEQLGIKGLSTSINGNLTELIGPDGKDAFKHPITIAVKINAQNEDFANLIGDAVTESVAGAVEYARANMQDLTSASPASKTYAGYYKSILPTLAINDIQYLSDLARNVTGLFSDDLENAVAQANAYGAAIGGTVTNSYDNLSSAVARYKDLKKKANKEDDPEKKAKLLANLAREKQLMDDLRASAQSSLKLATSDFASLSNAPGLQEEVIRGQRSTIDAMFKDSPQAAFLPSLFDKTSKLSKTIQFKIETTVASGRMSPSVLNHIFDIMGAGNEAGAAFQINAAVNLVGLDDANNFFSQVSGLNNAGLEKRIVGMANKEDAQGIKDLTAGMEAFMSMPDSVKKKINIAGLNPEKIREFGKNYAAFEEQPDIRKVIEVNDQYTAAFKAFGMTYDAFNKLPNINKAIVLSYITSYMNFKKTYDDTNALIADKKKLAAMGVDGSGVAELNRVSAFAGNGMQASLEAGTETVDTSVPADLPGTEPPAAPKDKSGGGGGDKADPIGDLSKSINDKLRLYTNISELYKKAGKKKNDFLSLVKRLSTSDSMVNQMRKAGLNEVLIAEIIGKGYADAQKIWAKYSEKRKSGKTVLTDLGKTMNAKSLYGNAAEQIAGLNESAKANRNRAQARNKLQGTGLTDAQIATTIQDDAVVNILAKLPKGTKMWREYIKALKDVAAAEKAAADPMQTQIDLFDEATGVINKAFDWAEFQKRNEAQAEFTKLNGMTVDEMQRQIDKNNRIIEDEQDLIKLKQDTINDLQHVNDLIQQGIDALSRQSDMRNRDSDALSHDLDIMAQQEAAIRKAYQERIDALDKVAAVNAEIVASQQAQLGLAQALSTGDIYGATSAAAAMRAQSAQAAAERTKASLQTGMENAVGGLLTSGGLTRDQAEAKIADIKEQNYQASLNIRIEEDKIFANNLAVRDLTNQIYDMNVNTIKPLEDKNAAMAQTIAHYQESLDWAIKDLVVAGMTREEWDNKVTAMQHTIDNAQALQPELDKIKTKYDEVAAAAAAAATAAGRLGVGGATTPNVGGPSWHPYGPGMTGGYYSAGGEVEGTGGIDSMLIKATPKEFVIRKAMVDKYGLPFFNALNQGSFVMPSYKMASPAGGVSASAATNMSASINAPVYNSVTVVVPDSNASPDAIANKVFNRMQGLDNSTIRTLRGIR